MTEQLVILDFGSQYTQVIARRIRECNVYSTIVRYDAPAKAIAALRPSGLILSGGPSSVYAPDAPLPDPAIFKLGLPVLGICYGVQLFAHFLGGICHCGRNWTMRNYVDQAVEVIRAQVGQERVILGLSGGVDSSVAAALLHKAIGDQLTCIFVNNGLLRAKEADVVREVF